MSKISKIITGTASFLLMLMSTGVYADVTQRDIQVAARALNFMEPPFNGEVVMGIVFDPANNRSRDQADAIRNMLGDGLTSGNLRLVPELVPVAEVANARVNLFFLTEFLGDISQLSVGRLPCVTVDIAQVRDGFCAMGIQSVPKIEIVVNQDAAAKSGKQFASVFRMMVREI